jgi:stearoyl-CoA desaturase (delta-9 desaturase)
MTNTSSVAPKPRLIWVNTLMFILTGLAAVVLVPWYGLSFGFSTGAWIAFGALVVLNEMSITAGYHRLWAHKTYDASALVRFIYMVFGSMALQNSAFVWCSGHRTHHLHVDDNDRDPYSAGRGFWFSHIGWMLRDYPSGRPNLANIPDLRKDPILAFQHEHYVKLAVGANFGIPMLVGWAIGDFWGTLMLAGFLRLVVSHHFTFFINSLAHMWGNRPYTDANTARDNGILAVLTFGEGYHNFHHLFAHDYRNGVRWWQWDPTKWLIATLKFLGLARGLKRAPAFQIQRALLAMQFRRAEEKLAKLPAQARHSHLDQLRALVAKEYEVFTKAVADWTRLKEHWLEDKKRAVMAHLEHSGFQKRLKVIERRLHLQQRRMRLLHAQLA